MDLEHPSISKTLKEGYPDGAGKPLYKNNLCADYSTNGDENKMEKTLVDLIFDVLQICMENDLEFRYQANIGLIDVFDGNRDCEDVSRGYIKKWKHEKPKESIVRVLNEVEEYLNE